MQQIGLHGGIGRVMRAFAPQLATDTAKAEELLAAAERQQAADHNQSATSIAALRAQLGSLQARILISTTQIYYIILY
jgi:hypothetical protein